MSAVSRASPPALPPELRADCAACVGLCCVIPPFDALQGFGFDKAAETPCHHLCADHRCGIHADLEAQGFTGCMAFDCLGAGQQLTRLAQERFGSADWRGRPEVARWLFDAYAGMRRLQEWRARLWLAERVAGLDLGSLAVELEAQLAQAPDWTEPQWRNMQARVAALLAPLARQNG